MSEFTITEPTTLLGALQKIRDGASNTLLRELLKQNRVTVNGKKEIRAQTDLNTGDEIAILPAIKRIGLGIEVLFDDRYLIIINKPAGLLSVPLDMNKNVPHALGALRSAFNTKSIFAVHRLDRETSGVMIFARGGASMDALKKMFARHDFTRTYLAITLGEMEKTDGEWTGRLYQTNEYEVLLTNDPAKGKKALTHFTVLSSNKKYSFLRLNLKTGRKHQIRVHCKEAGHPIVGDEKYNADPNSPAGRMCLHACSLEFCHPFTKKPVVCSAAIPPEMANMGFPTPK